LKQEQTPEAAGAVERYRDRRSRPNL